MRFSLRAQSNILAVLSEKEDGNMSFAGSRKARENRRKFLTDLDINPNQVVGADLKHGDKVKIVGADNTGELVPNTDGLLTSKKGVYLALTVADCLPVFLFKPKKEIVGLVHCGWQGLAEDILCKTCGKIEDKWGKSLDNLLVFIGPGICGGCYKIHKERAEKFLDYREALVSKGENVYLDLKKVAKLQLLNSGVLEKNIKVSTECTAELPDKYFSYWRKRVPLRTMLAIIGAKKG